MKLKLDNVAIAVGDLAAMSDWYASALGLRVAERGSIDQVEADYALLDGDGFRIELISRRRPAVPVDRRPPPTHLDVLGLKALVFDVDDLPKLTQSLAASGVEILWADEPMFGRRSTLIRDLEGNLVNLLGSPVDVVGGARPAR